ncbi:hypothetical protein DENSPDRAFT_845084 [Dentipellis sp. KUC8613]|nr:hypothetical protein DENSPDRAFT_845084 [Dentipellis sp. KUC8613]
MPRVPAHKRRSKAQREQLRSVQALRHAHAHAPDSGLRDAAGPSSSKNDKLSGLDDKAYGSNNSDEPSASLNNPSTSTTDHDPADRSAIDAEIQSALEEMDTLVRELQEDQEMRDEAVAEGIWTKEMDRTFKKAERCYERYFALLRDHVASLGFASASHGQSDSNTATVQDQPFISASPTCRTLRSSTTTRTRAQAHPTAHEVLDAQQPGPPIATRASVTAVAEDPLSKPELIQALVDMGIERDNAPRVVQAISRAFLKDVVFPDDIAEEL